MLIIKDGLLTSFPDNTNLGMFLKFKGFKLRINEIVLIGIQLKLIIDDEIAYFVIIDKYGKSHFIHCSPTNTDIEYMDEFFSLIGFSWEDLSKYSYTQSELKYNEILKPLNLKGKPIYWGRESSIKRFCQYFLEIFRMSIYSKETRNEIKKVQIN